ncbi:MAG: hypothetical protein AB1486_15290 [Planctomycetota bacterium]
MPLRRTGRVAGALLPIVVALLLLLTIAGTGLLRLLLHSAGTATLEVEHGQARFLAEAGLQWGLLAGAGSPGAIPLGPGQFTVTQVDNRLICSARVGDANAQASCDMSVVALQESRLDAGGWLEFSAVNLLPFPCTIEAVELSWTDHVLADTGLMASPPGTRSLRLVDPSQPDGSALRSGARLELRGEGEPPQTTLTLRRGQLLSVRIGPFRDTWSGQLSSLASPLDVRFHTTAGELPGCRLPP